MIKILFISIILLLSKDAVATWQLPNTPMSIGDPGSFYLNTEGLTLHFFNNDYLGRTDKLMTGSGSLFLYLIPNNQKKHGWEISVQRRLITPIIQTKYGQPSYSPPKGVYGDQLESRLGYSYTSGHYKFELGISGEYYAGLGGDRIQKFLHTAIGAKDETHKYGEKIDGSYLAGSIGFGLVSKYVLLMIYGRESPIMRDAIARLSLKFGGKTIQLGLQGEYAYQFQSDFYLKDIEETRYGYGLSFKWDWYQMSVSYVSPYLKYDKFGQYFISPLIVSYEF